MKKIIKIFLLFIISIALVTTCVNAEDEACKITLSADKTTLKPGDIVTITLTMENVTKASGIIELGTYLEFDNSIFEIQSVEDQELANELGMEGSEAKIIYSGRKDIESNGTNSWYLLLGEEDGLYAVAGATEGDPVIASQSVGKIKLKVKDNAGNTSATIKLTDTLVYDAESTEYSISDSEIGLQIIGASGSTSSGNSVVNNDYDTIEDDSDIMGNSIGNQSQKNNTQTENKATGQAPYTGVEDYIPFIFIGIIICTVAYINYKKYKNI